MATPDLTPAPPPAPVATGDTWTSLRRFTAARIALGRTGGSQPTATVLDFRLAHARARDAVNAPFHHAPLAATLAGEGLSVELLATLATDRRAHLLRPDLGRQLAPDAQTRLAALTKEVGPVDLAVAMSDGLAAAAVERHAAATLLPLLRELRAAGWRVSPVFIVPFARVKIQDEIGALLRARFSLILLGERPGLGTPDSLGAYLVADPAPARTDADRNCISNIRPEGLPPPAAAQKLAWLLRESARTGRRGLELKDDQPPPARHERGLTHVSEKWWR